MSAHGFTAEQIEEAISSALKSQDMETVVSLLHLLATVAPDRASIILSAIQIMSGTS